MLHRLIISQSLTIVAEGFVCLPKPFYPRLSISIEKNPELIFKVCNTRRPRAPLSCLSIRLYITPAVSGLRGADEQQKTKFGSTYSLYVFNIKYQLSHAKILQLARHKKAIFITILVSFFHRSSYQDKKQCSDRQNKGRGKYKLNKKYGKKIMYVRLHLMPLLTSITEQLRLINKKKNKKLVSIIKKSKEKCCAVLI